MPESEDRRTTINDRAFALFKGTCGRGIYQELTRDIEIFPVLRFKRRGRRDETSPYDKKITAEIHVALNIPRYATAIVTANEIVDVMPSGQSLELSRSVYLRGGSPRSASCRVPRSA